MIELMFESGEESPPPWAVGLNAEQRAAAAHESGPLLIVAGAGTGKTRTLVARVSRLVHEGVQPERILLLTFTRRAAQEMMDRVGAATERRVATRLWGGTFHSVASRLLRTNGGPGGSGLQFSVLDPGDAGDLMNLVRTESGHGRSRRRFPRAQTLVSIHSRVVNSQRKLSEVVEEHFPWVGEHTDALKEIFRSYTARKRRQRVLDYDDLLLMWRALVTSPAGAKQLGGLFDHILIDEYQDTNPIQADIVRQMCSGGAQLTVVGDDAQAIYGFRAATVENMWRFSEDFPGATTLTLTGNYRSTEPVLAVANAIVSQSEFLVPKMLESMRGTGVRPRLVTCADEGAQSVAVCDRVLELREEGVSLEDQAVLFRAGHHSDHLELELIRRNIPFVKYGGLKFLEAAHVKDLMALLRVLENPSDELAWNRCLSMLAGVGPATVARITEEIGVADPEVGDPLARFLATGPGLAPRAKEGLELLAGAWEACPDLDPADQVAVMHRFCSHVFPARYDDHLARLGDLDQLAVTARSYRTRGEFLTELVLDPPERTGDLAGPPHLDDEYLTLSTIHSAKGREWTAVHLIHAADGNIPSDMSLGDAHQLDEELRLAYVAVTRARDHLEVNFPLRYHVHRHAFDDRHHLAPLSRFLEPVREHFDPVAAGPDASDEATAIEGVDLTDEVDMFLEGLWD